MSNQANKCPTCETPLCCDTCDCPQPPEPNPGRNIDAIMARMDAAYAARREAGYPSEGPLVDALEAVYTDLRAWTAALR